MNLKKVRKENEYTQQEVADELEISRTTYLEAENGNRELKAPEIRKLSNLFNKPIRAFFSCDKKESDERFCSTCNVEDRVREMYGLLHAHGHWTAASCLKGLLDGKHDDEL